MIFSGACPRAPVSGALSPEPPFGEGFPRTSSFRGAAPDPVRSSREGLFISFSWKKETKQRKSTGCTDFTKNRALQAKMLKLGSSASSNR
jgi:hypothetical protein